MNFNKKNIIIILVIISILFFVFEKIVFKDSELNDITVSEQDIIESQINEKTEEKEEMHEVANNKDEQDWDDEKLSEVSEEKIYVYVSGEVNNVGVVILNKGSRIIDAIDAAGGTTERANISKINLVYPLQDGMKINIPNNEELKKENDFKYIIMGSGDQTNDEDKIEDNAETKTSIKEKSERKVNINSATQTELETLPGIGPSLALKIINYRKENGKFSSVEDLKNVSGIGDNKFEQIKNYIVI